MPSRQNISIPKYIEVLLKKGAENQIALYSLQL